MRIFSAIGHFLRIRGFRDIACRFPLPLTAAALMTVILIHQNHYAASLWQWSKNPFFGIYMLTVLMMLYSAKLAWLAWALYTESHPLPRMKAILGAGAIGLVLAALYFGSADVRMPFLFVVPGLALMLVAAPFIGREADDDACCRFACGLLNSIFFAALAALILCAGISGALASIEYLFGVHFRNIYGDVWILGFLCATYWTLANLPRAQQMQEAGRPYPKGTAFIVTFILVPLVLFYIAILYAYAVKIALMWELPKGRLGFMTSAFGMIGVLTHFLAFPLRESGTRLLRFTQRWLFPLLGLPVLLLVLAASARIAAYGVTEERYLLVLIAIWLAYSCYHGTRYRGRRLMPIALVASLLLIAAGMGPWGAVAVSTMSQKQVLRKEMTALGLLEEGHIVAAKEMPAYSDARYQRVRSLLRYFTETRKTDAIAEWFPADSGIHTMGKRPGDYGDAQALMAELGLVQQSYANGRGTDNDRWFRFNREPEIAGGGRYQLLDVGGFDRLVRFDAMARDKRMELVTQTGKMRYAVALVNDRLLIENGSGRKLQFNLRALAERLKKQNAGLKPPYRVKGLDLAQTDGVFSAYLRIRTLYGNSDWEKGTVSTLGFTLLLREGTALTQGMVPAEVHWEKLPETFVSMPPATEGN